MKQIKLLVVAVFTIFTTNTFAQKIAHVNMETIVVDMPEYKVAMDSMKQEQVQVEGRLKKLEFTYQKSMKTYQDSAKLWSAAYRSIKQNELKTMEENYKAFYQMSSMNLDSMQQVVLGRLIKKVKKAATEVAKEKGITYVLNYSEQAQMVLYYEESHDITGAVRKKLIP
ncbi:MAG: OmpH family outer membrane protein [Bacteroidia bacterium]